MCRWLAYLGEPIRLDSLLLRAKNSIVGQSRSAAHTPYALNGDGYGVGWYADEDVPGLFRDVLPAWNDENLRELSRQVHSSLFFAHVRATSGTGIQRTNCHPFRYRHWLFQHNGEIEGYDALRRRLEMAIAPELFGNLQGTTDSERIFLLALTYGLEDDPIGALARAAHKIEEVAAEDGIATPIHMTVAMSNGERIFAVRYASGGKAPSLFHSKDLDAVRECAGNPETVPEGAFVVVSEPLDDFNEHWQEIGQATALTVERGSVTTADFCPAKA